MARAFEERVAIVTGGASGIGRALAVELLARGASVVLADRDGDGAQASAAALSADAEGAGRVSTLELDVTDAEAVRACVERVARERGRLDYQFNNAGIAVVGPAEQQSLDDWRRILDVNVLGVVHGVHAAYPLMLAQGHGHIVNTASVAGLIPAPGFSAYAASKHAVVGLSLALRAEAAGRGVRVSAACPGFVDTPMVSTCELRGLARDRAQSPVGPITPQACARAILRGVARNQALIVVSGHGRAMALAQRYAPWLSGWIARRAGGDLHRESLASALSAATEPA